MGSSRSLPAKSVEKMCLKLTTKFTAMMTQMKTTSIRCANCLAGTVMIECLTNVANHLGLLAVRQRFVMAAVEVV